MKRINVGFPKEKATENYVISKIFPYDMKMPSVTRGVQGSKEVLIEFLAFSDVTEEFKTIVVPFLLSGSYDLIYWNVMAHDIVKMRPYINSIFYNLMEKGDTIKTYMSNMNFSKSVGMGNYKSTIISPHESKPINIYVNNANYIRLRRLFSSMTNLMSLDITALYNKVNDNISFDRITDIEYNGSCEVVMGEISSVLSHYTFSTKQKVKYPITFVSVAKNKPMKNPMDKDIFLAIYKNQFLFQPSSAIVEDEDVIIMYEESDGIDDEHLSVKKVTGLKIDKKLVDKYHIFEQNKNIYMGE